VTTPEGLKRIRVYTLVVMLATVCIAQAGSVAHVIVAMMPFHWLPVAIVFGAIFPLLNVALALGGMVSRGGEELRRKYILATAFFATIELLFNYVEAFRRGAGAIPAAYATALWLPADTVLRLFSLLAGASLPLMALTLTYFLVKEGEAAGNLDGPDANREHYVSGFDRVFGGSNGARSARH
jgi:hypothetical protein